MKEADYWKACFDLVTDIDIAIYGRAVIIPDGTEILRTEREEGWNDCVFHIIKLQGELSKRCHAGEDDPLWRKQLEMVKCDVLIREPEFQSWVLLNDTFGYACSDSEAVPEEEIDLVHGLTQKWGWYGAVAWSAKRLGLEPLPQISENPMYRAARESLSTRV